MQHNIKLYHWQTTIYVRHKATDELLDHLLDAIDKFIEIYIGKYKRPSFKNGFNIPVKELNDDDIVSLLKSYIKFLNKDIYKYLKKSDTDLLNVRDDILGHLNKTLYLFTLN